MALFDFSETDVPLTEAEEGLPEAYASLPASYVDDPDLVDLYKQLILRLFKENPDRDIAETLAIERCASMYVYMKKLERTDGFRNSNDYRHLATTWSQMVKDLQRERVKNIDVGEIRSEAIKEIMTIVFDALKGFEPEIANTMRRRILLGLGDDI